MAQHHCVKEDDSSKERQDRHYVSSSLPIMRKEPHSLNTEEQRIRLELYKEICTSWRTLVDVRFKLLGFVPASIAIIIVILSSNTNELKLPQLLTAGIQTGIALFGLIVTYALYVYDKRNSQFHDDLISRGRRIEDELGVDTGQFRGRLKSHKSVLPQLSKHLFSWNDVSGTNVVPGTNGVLGTDNSKLIKFLKTKYGYLFNWDKVPGNDSGRLDSKTGISYKMGWNCKN